MVIGCGQSGLLAGIRLREAGIPFTIIDKNAGPGGTWWENSYPGARVDVGSHFYCYSFEPADHWTEYFSQHAELRDYFVGVMHKYGIDEHCRFETEVEAATYDEAAGTWTVRVRAADGTVDELPARAVISAVGSLNRPKLPDIPGIDDFDARRSIRSGGTTRSMSPAAVRARRRRRHRLPDRPDDRRSGRAAERFPADRAMDVPESELPRAGT